MLNYVSVGLVLLLALVNSGSATAQNGLPNLGVTFAQLNRSVLQLAGGLWTAAEIRNMTAHEVWCEFDFERQDWCGGTFAKPYQLCITMTNVTWQSSFPTLTDFFLYLNYTADAAPTSTIWPGIASLCVCENGGNVSAGEYPLRAYYIPEEVFPVPRYQSGCHAEAGLLFCYVLLAVLYLIILWWTLLELVMWILIFATKEKTCNILGGFLPKVFCFLTSILLLANIGVINGGASATAEWKFAVYWIWILAGIFLISAYLWWLVVFADVVMKTTKLSKETSLLITIMKWLVVFFVSLVLLGFLITMGISYNFALRLSKATYFPDKADLYTPYVRSRQANITLGCIMVFLVILWGTFLTGFSSYMIFKNKNSELRHKMGAKTFWNTIALIFLWPVLGTLIVVAWYVSWHMVEISEYQTQIAFMWTYMIENYAIWMILLAITIALRTHFAEDSGYCASICGNLKVMEEQTMSRGSSSGTRTKGISGGSGTTVN